MADKKPGRVKKKEPESKPERDWGLVRGEPFWDGRPPAGRPAVSEMRFADLLNEYAANAGEITLAIMAEEVVTEKNRAVVQRQLDIRRLLDEKGKEIEA